MRQFKEEDLFSQQYPYDDGTKACDICGAKIQHYDQHLKFHNTLGKLLQDLISKINAVLAKITGIRELLK